MKSNKPEVVIIAAAKVGGIYANSNYPAEFLYDNFIGAKEKLVLIDCTMIPKIGHCDRWNNYILMYSN